MDFLNNFATNINNNNNNLNNKNSNFNNTNVKVFESVQIPVRKNDSEHSILNSPKSILSNNNNANTINSKAYLSAMKAL